MKILKGLAFVLIAISILLCIFTYEQLLKYNIDEFTTLYFREYNVTANLVDPDNPDDTPVVVPSATINIAGIDYIGWFVQRHGEYIELEFSDDIPNVIPTFRIKAYGHIDSEYYEESDGYTIFHIDRLYIQYDISTIFKLLNSELVRYDNSRVPFGDVINDEAGFFTWASTNIKVTFQLINNALTLLGGLLIL